MFAYRPCLPTRAPKAPTGALWVHEIKHDGFRIVARRVDRAVTLYTKQGHDWTKRYPLIVEALLKLRVSSIVLDGEAMAFDRNGQHDFEALWNGTQDEAVQLCAFDLLELNGDDFRDKPLGVRKRRLSRFAARDGLQLVEHIEGDGAEIFAHVCKLGLEGIVSKRVDLGYEAGPSKR